MTIWQIVLHMYLLDFPCKNILWARRWVEGNTRYDRTIRDTEGSLYNKISYKHNCFHEM